MPLNKKEYRKETGLFFIVNIMVGKGWFKCLAFKLYKIFLLLSVPRAWHTIHVYQLRVSSSA